MSLIFISSCAVKIIPSIEKGTTVAILDHGRHASLLIQLDDKKMFRYSYGDWDFYARGEDTFFNGLKALFWPTTGCLGRKEFEQLSVPVEKMIVVQADTKKVLALKEHLDTLFFQGQDTLLSNIEYDLEFVHHPETYWALNNSNQMVARWLEAIGVKVKGAALFSHWED